MQKVIKKYRNDGFIPLCQEVIFHSNRKLKRRIYQPLKFKLWEIDLIDIDSLYGEEYYKKMGREKARQDAYKFVTLLVKQYDPNSVIDLGCGIGRFMEPFHELGIDVKGLDGSNHAAENPINSNLKIEVHDLTIPYSFSSTADLVLCIEVLEHLPESTSDVIVETISNAAPIAVVTFARPGQGGSYHVNEKPLKYWVNKFESEGMTYDKRQSEILKKMINVDELEWLNSNIAVFFCESV